MPRVLLTGFCSVPGPRRAGVQLRHVIRALTPMHSVDLLVVREGEQGYVERQGSVRILRVPAPESDLKAQIQSFQRALKRQLEGADYDVVHCRDSWSGLTVLEARDRLGYAVVYDLTRAPIGESALDPELDAQYGRDEEACMLAADVVLTPTLAATRAMEARGTPNRVFMAPPGVDVDRFDWDDAPTGGPPRIVYAGSIDAGRGVRVLIRAMAAIVREVDARLVLAGPVVSPKFEQALKDGIRELGLTDKVDLLGVVEHDQIPALLATAAVCVVPAASDFTPNPTVGFPTKLLEYMACKRPIVAPRRETVQQVVENGREALLFEPGDPIDLARKVLRILGEPALGAQLAAIAYERVRRDFTASAARRAIQKTYTVIAERFGSLEDADDDSPKVEMLTDDDFEATVFEQAPLATPHHTLSDALEQMESSTSSSQVVAPPSAAARFDDTIDRAPVALAPAPVPVTGEFSSPPLPDDWVVSNIAGADFEEIEIDTGAVEKIDLEAGTPVEGTARAMPGSPASTSKNVFVAGEIDVPTPPPEMRSILLPEMRSILPPEMRSILPQVAVEAAEFIAASSLLGNTDPDPDTGSRTPPLERRNP